MKRYIITVSFEYFDNGRYSVSGYLNDFSTLEEAIDYLKHLKCIEEQNNFICFDIEDTFENRLYIYDSKNGLSEYE